MIKTIFKFGILWFKKKLLQLTFTFELEGCCLDGTFYKTCDGGSFYSSNLINYSGATILNDSFK